MYAALGNREKQKEIRNNTPDLPHCELLEISANACDGCPKNPFSVNRKSREDAEQHISMITWAQRLGDYANLGVLPGLDVISPREALAARLALAHARVSEQRRFAKMIGIEVGRIVGELLAVMFKGRGHGR